MDLLPENSLCVPQQKMQKVEGGVDEAMKINRTATRGPVVSKQHSLFPSFPPIR